LVPRGDHGLGVGEPISLLVVNYNQEQTDVLVDVTHKLTLRGGYRYVWGDAETGNMLIAGPGQESSELRQQVGIAGINFRATQKLTANVDFEGAASGSRLLPHQPLQLSEDARPRPIPACLHAGSASQFLAVEQSESRTPASTTIS
jgi:hypothetical protein